MDWITANRRCSTGHGRIIHHMGVTGKDRARVIYRKAVWHRICIPTRRTETWPGADYRVRRCLRLVVKRLATNRVVQGCVARRIADVQVLQCKGLAPARRSSYSAREKSRRASSSGGHMARERGVIGKAVEKPWDNLATWPSAIAFLSDSVILSVDVNGTPVVLL